MQKGDMVRIRMDDVPRKANINGDIQDIDLNDDEGIGEETAFLYSPSTNTLLLQRNRHGISPSLFASYFKQKSNVQFTYLDPILRTDVFDRLRLMNVIKTFNVKMAGVTNPEYYKGVVNGINSIIDLKETYSAPDITVKMSMGKRGGSLSLEQVMSTIRDLLSNRTYHNDQIRNMVVTARESDENKFRNFRYPTGTYCRVDPY